MHTFREPMLRKQSDPFAIDSSPNGAGDSEVYGRRQVGKSKGSGHRRLILGFVVVALAGMGVFVYENEGITINSNWWAVLPGSISTARPAPVIPKPIKINRAKLDYQRTVKEITSPVTMLPQWVQAAIVRDNAALTRARKNSHDLSGHIAQIHKQNQQLTAHVHQLQTSVLDDQVRINQLEGQLHTLALRSRPAHETAHRLSAGAGKTGLVALQAPQKPDTTVRYHLKPAERPAKGWLVVAVHGDKAVLQTPEGQVAMVKPGQSLAGKTVERIDDNTQTVLLSGGFVVHLLGK